MVGASLTQYFNIFLEKARNRWPSTDIGGLHPNTTFASSEGQPPPKTPPPVDDTTGTESSVEVETPSPTYTKTPGGAAFNSLCPKVR